MSTTNTSPDGVKCLPHPNPAPCFWQDAKHKLHDHRSTETLPDCSDILIVGAGYAGIATAYHLVKDARNAGKRITILEARGVCSGATGRNGGHLRPDMYGHIPTYISRAGVRAGAEIAEFEVRNMWAVKKAVEDEGIECDFVLTRSTDVWCNEEAAGKARATYDAMVAHGLEYIKDVVTYGENDAEGISGVKGAKAAFSFTAGSMSPYKFILSLTEKILATGLVNLQTNTPALSITQDAGQDFLIATPRGTTKAAKIIHASNGYASHLLPEYRKNIIPCKGICCRITVPEGKIAPLVTNTYINRTSDTTLSYLIPRADGSIVVGGAQAKFKPHLDQWYNNVDDGVLIESARDYYDGYMQRTYRGWEDSGARVDGIWTGVMGYSYDSNPHVGEVPGKPGQYVLAGFNGHGMPVIWLSAKGIADMVNDEGAGAFEKTGLPGLFRTSQARIDKALSGKEEDGDILG